MKINGQALLLGKLAGTAILAYLLLPQMGRKKKMAPFLTYNYAHRGLHDAVNPENSLGAFRKAVDHGYGMEFDVQLSGDGIPFVFHDDSLLRVCGVDAVAQERKMQELQLPLYGSEQTIPRFSQVLRVVEGKVPLIIELKLTQRKEALVEAVLKELEEYPGPFVIESFDPKIMKIVRKQAPQILRGQLSGGLYREKKSLVRFVADRLLLNMYSRPDFIAYDHREGECGLRLYHLMFGTPLISYTIKNQKDYHRKSHFSAHIFEGFLPPPRRGTER